MPCYFTLLALTSAFAAWNMFPTFICSINLICPLIPNWLIISSMKASSTVPCWVCYSPLCGFLANQKRLDDSTQHSVIIVVYLRPSWIPLGQCPRLPWPQHLAKCLAQSGCQYMFVIWTLSISCSKKFNPKGCQYYATVLLCVSKRQFNMQFSHFSIA